MTYLKSETAAGGVTKGPKGDPGDVSTSQMDTAIALALDPYSTTVEMNAAIAAVPGVGPSSVDPTHLNADNSTEQLAFRTRLNFVSREGDAMIGHLQLPTGPGAANAVRKDYVDAADAALQSSLSGQITAKLNKAGDTATGDITISRSSGPTTGALILGNAGAALYFDASAFFLNHNLVVSNAVRGVQQVFANESNANTGQVYIQAGGAPGWGGANTTRWYSAGSVAGLSVHDNTSGGTGIYSIFLRDDGATLGSIVGSGSGITYNTTSDERSKENITPVVELLGFDIKSRIMGLQVVQYSARGGDPNQKQVGLVAQQAVKHMPEIVTPPPATRPKALATDAPDPPWMIAYPSAVPQLIAAMQAMWREIDALKAQLESRPA